MAVLDKGEIREGLLAIRVDHDDERCLVALEGEMDLANSPAAEVALREAVADAPGRVVVDMRELSFIDSTGIALLLRLLHADGGGDRLRFLLSRNRGVTRVLRITGVDEKLAPASRL